MLERDDFQSATGSGSRSPCTSSSTRCCRATTRSNCAATSRWRTDQLFNLLSAATCRRPPGAADLPDDALIEGSTAAKMSKSLGNYVGVAEPASTQFGKLMKSATTAAKYFLLLTDVPSRRSRRCCATR